MGKEILTFDNTEIVKSKFYRRKSPIFGGDVDIEKVSVSKKISFSQKTVSTLLVSCTIIIKQLLM